MTDGGKLVLLTDSPGWCEPLRERLAGLGLPVVTVDARRQDWCPSDPWPNDWLLVVNRLAARPPDDGALELSTRSAVTLYRDMVASLELQGRLTGTPRAIVNGATCHHVGVSKAMQATLFASLGLATPETRVVHPGSKLDASAGGSLLVKPNAGGKGAGIVPVQQPGSDAGASPQLGDDDTFAADGIAVLQRRVDPEASSTEAQPASDGGTVDGADCVHRVEILGGEALYVAHAPVASTTFNNCLADVCTRPRKRAVGISPASIDHGPTQRAVAGAKAAAAACGMSVGSVEYLLDGATGEPVFIDINPVSTLMPAAAAVLSRDPVQAQAEWIRERWLELVAGPASVPAAAPVA